MKQIIVLLCIVFFSFFAWAQAPFAIQIEVADSAKSIFSQNRILLNIPDPVSIDTTSGEANYHLTASALHDSYKFFVKFPSTDWISISDNKMRPSHFESTVVVRRIEKFEYIELFPLFLSHPEIFEAVKNGTEMELRFQIYASEDGGPYQYIYSNVKSIHLPAASESDINALAYVKTHMISPEDFLISEISQGQLSEIEYIMEHYPNSLVSEWAALKKFAILRENKFLVLGNSNAYRQWVNEYVSTIKPTAKSDRVSDYLEQISK